MVTMSGMQQVQSRDFVFYLHQQQLSAVQRDPENHRLQVRVGHAAGRKECRKSRVGRREGRGCCSQPGPG